MDHSVTRTNVKSKGWSPKDDAPGQMDLVEEIEAKVRQTTEQWPAAAAAPKAERQRLLKFYRDTLPTEAADTVFLLGHCSTKSAKPYETTVCHSHDEMADQTLQLRKKKQVWCSLAGFNREAVENFLKKQDEGEIDEKKSPRNNAHVSRMRSLRWEIDIEPAGFKERWGKSDFDGEPALIGKDPAHTNIEDARASITDILASVGLNPTYVINSGGGLHVYAALDRDVSAAEFRAMASYFMALVKERDPKLALDTSRWTDPSGYMRPPFSLNHKQKYIELDGKPRRVEIVS